MRFTILLGFCCLLTMAGCGKKQPVTPLLSVNQEDRDYHEGKLGTSARDLLTAERYTTLRIEVQYLQGFAPDPVAMMNVQQFLQEHLQKPGGVYFHFQELPAGPDTVWSLLRVHEFQRQHRTLFNRNYQMSLYILYTNGRYTDRRILAEAFKNTSIVVYGQAIKEHERVYSIPTQTTIETGLLLHEIGHLLGLVNQGTEMQQPHEDRAHKAHCRNPDCLMYWHVSVQPKFGPLRIQRVPCLDSACLQDLRKLAE